MADYLKIPEVARRLDVSEPTVRRMVKSGKLPSVFVGGAYRVNEEDLEKYLKDARVRPGAGPGKAPAPRQLDLEENRGGDNLTHITVLLDKISGTRSIAREIAQEWRGEAERSLKEGRPLARYRTLEMRSFHNELSRIYIASIHAIQRGARQGITGVLREGGEQMIATDPGLWPRELREFVYEAGASIAVLPEVISTIEKELATGQLQAAAERALYEEFNVEDHFPTELFLEEDWREAVDRASSRVKA